MNSFKEMFPLDVMHRGIQLLRSQLRGKGGWRPSRCTRKQTGKGGVSRQGDCSHKAIFS